MDEGSITREVREFITDKIASGVIVNVGFLTEEIIAGKDAIEGSDLPFYRVCAYTHVKRIVRSCIGKYDASPETDEQLVLPGFDHLQVAYSVERNGDHVLVPVDLCTDEELAARADEYDEMAKGCQAHAKEIRKYIEARDEARAA